MNIGDLTEDFLLSLAASDMGPEDLKLMFKINKNHYLPTKNMTQEELNRARILAIRGWIDLVPEDHRASYSQVERDVDGNVIKWGPRTHEHNPAKPIPERYVMLSSGNHALGTFDFDLDKDIAEYYLNKRKHIKWANKDLSKFYASEGFKHIDENIMHRATEKRALKDLKRAGEELLSKALDDNQGTGINVHFHGQHFGWFKWDKKNKEHEEFSIGDFKDDDEVGTLEEVVGRLKNINLEDYRKKSASFKEAADKPKFLSLVPPLSKEQSGPLNQDQIKDLDKVEIKDKPKLTVVKNRGETEEERQLRMRKVEDRKAKLFSSNLYQGLLMGDEDFFPTSPIMMIDYFSKGSKANNQYYFEISKQVADDLPKTRYQDVKQYFSKLLKSFPIFDDDYIGTVYPPINGIEVSLRERPDKILVTIQAEDNSREY